MDLYPESHFLHFRTLTLGGVKEKWVPVKELIPITKYDYWCSSWQVFFRQPHCLDLDMIYAHVSTKQVFTFDKFGEWHDEGIEHQALSLDKTYNETKWYDEFMPNAF